MSKIKRILVKSMNQTLMGGRKSCNADVQGNTKLRWQRAGLGNVK